MKGIVKLRILNFIGAVFFTMYGLVIDAYPVAFVNLFICFVNIYYLSDIFKSKEFFSILEVQPGSAYLKYFLEFHDKDIRKFIPSFKLPPNEISIVFFILRNSIPAGLIYAAKREADSLFIELDYVIPGYRDLKIGKYVYKNIFDYTGAEKLYSYPGNKKHEKYLQKMGFSQCTIENEIVYCLNRT
jgi:hypothetical protein